MFSFVLDASVALTWCFPQEATDATRGLWQAAQLAPISVPPIFPIELQNILWTGKRRGRISQIEAEVFWAKLSQLDIQITSSSVFPAQPSLYQSARSHHLTAYDASYLELALSLHLPLATLDADLRMAARAAGLTLLL